MTTPTQPGTTLESERARNIDVWKLAEVYTSEKDDAQVNADGTFDPEVWSFVGLLNEGSDVGNEMQVDRTEIKSFGGVTQIVDVKVDKDTRTFDALEDNDVTFPLMWPGSDFKRNEAGVLMSPDFAAQRVIAFKTTNSFGDTLIDVSRRKATIYVDGKASKNDDGATVSTFMVEVLKDSKNAFYDRLRIEAKDMKREIPDVIRFKDAGTTPGGGSTPTPPSPQIPTDKTVTLPANVTGGTWTLTVDGKTTAEIAYDATGDDVTTTTMTAGIAGVTVTGAAGGPYVIKGATAVTADGTELTGGDTTDITVA